MTEKIEWYKEVLELEPNSKVFFPLARMLAEEQRTDEAVEILEQNPLIGRPVANSKRELVIGRRSHGYVALYRYVHEIDTVFVLAIRSRREAGYSERDSAG